MRLCGITAILELGNGGDIPHQLQNHMILIQLPLQLPYSIVALIVASPLSLETATVAIVVANFTRLNIVLTVGKKFKMVECEHFIYAMFNEVGYKLIKSEGVDKLVLPETLNYLCHIGGNISEEKRYQVLLPTENVLAIIYLRPAKDEYGRKGVWNHTILLRIPNMEPHFIKELVDPLESLEPLKVETK